MILKKILNNAMNKNEQLRALLYELDVHFSFLKLLLKTRRKFQSARDKTSGENILPLFLYTTPDLQTKERMELFEHLHFEKLPSLEAALFKQSAPGQNGSSLITIYLHQNALYFSFEATLFSLSKENQKIFWHYLQKKIKKSRVLFTAGMILITRLSNIARHFDSETHSLIVNLSALSQSFSQNVAPLPFYLLFTELNCLAGFNSFKQSFPTEYESSLGFFIDKNKTVLKRPQETSSSPEYENEFKNAFCNFLNNLQERSLSFLPHTHSPLEAQNIYSFCLQIESLENNLIQFIKALNFVDYSFGPSASKAKHVHSLPFLLRGIFFSAEQKETPQIDRLGKALTPLIRQSVDISYLPHSSKNESGKTQHFFCAHLFQQIILQDCLSLLNEYRKPLSPKILYSIKIAGITCLMSIALIGLSISFKHRISLLSHLDSTLRDTQNIYEQFTQKDTLTIREFAGLINNLDNLLTQEKKIKQFNFFRIVSNQQKKIMNLAEKQEQQILMSLVLPQLAKQIEKSISETNKKEIDKLYNALKAYLMLASPINRDNAYLLDWLNHDWHNRLKLPIKQIKTLNTVVKPLLSQLPVIPLNNQLIWEIRAILVKQPPAYLAFLLLKQHYQQDASLPFQDSNQVLLGDKSESNAIENKKSPNNTSIPSLFSRECYDLIYEQEIAAASQQVIRGNWVLGQNTTTIQKNTLDSLIEDVRILFVNQYLHWWRSYFYRLRPINLSVLHEASEVLTHFKEGELALGLMLNRVMDNTRTFSNPTPAHITFNTQIAAAFKDAQSISPKAIARLENNLETLGKFLQKIEQSEEANALIFAFTVKHFLHPEDQSDPLFSIFDDANSFPEPLKNWANAIATNVWALFLGNSKTYINEKWSQQVFKTYQDNLADRYPFIKTSQKEVALKNFAQFFAPDGTFNTFFQNYLEPFIDTSQHNWTLKSIHGLSVPISDENIKQLIIARLIRKMFFENEYGTGAPFEEFSFHFTLKVEEFEPIIRDIVFTFSGQRFFAYQGSKNAVRFSWPKHSGDNQVKILLEMVNEENALITESGEWAWFRLLDKSVLKQLADLQSYDLTVSIMGNIAKFSLKTDNPINPYELGVIRQFFLPNFIVS